MITHDELKFLSSGEIAIQKFLDKLIDSLNDEINRLSQYDDATTSPSTSNGMKQAQETIEKIKLLTKNINKIFDHQKVTKLLNCNKISINQDVLDAITCGFTNFKLRDNTLRYPAKKTNYKSLKSQN